MLLLISPLALPLALILVLLHTLHTERGLELPLRPCVFRSFHTRPRPRSKWCCSCFFTIYLFHHVLVEEE